MKTPSWLTSTLAATALIPAFSCNAFAGSGTLYSFKSTGTTGATPLAPLVTDSRGNLYGTTHSGGAANQGTVFELSPNGSGGYTFTQIYAFQFAAGDAGGPDNGPLLLDSAGNLYGTTLYGGALSFGAVYEISPQPGGGWAEKVIMSFGESDVNVYFPNGGVVMDAGGNLYGAAQNGGAHSAGGVFRLTPDGSGGWTESVIYSFAGNRYGGPDGFGPVAGLTFDAVGNLYGTTVLGGAHANGTVYELSPGPGGTWTEQVIHSFTGFDSCSPQSNLVVDHVGNVYGTTFTQGAYTQNCTGYGTAFKLAPSSSGWTETVLHRFGASAHDGALPNGITLDAAGNLYGTTWLGGAFGYGAVYKLTPTASGPWTESPVHNFTAGQGGGQPRATIIFGIDGNLYGTTASYGGKNGEGAGTVYELFQ